MFRVQAVPMKKHLRERADVQNREEAKPRRMRADAQRKMGSLVQAATEVFATSGVDAPVREIAEKAGRQPVFLVP
jgi:hypothetical protein